MNSTDRSEQMSRRKPVTGLTWDVIGMLVAAALMYAMAVGGFMTTGR